MAIEDTPAGSAQMVSIIRGRIQQRRQELRYDEQSFPVYEAVFPGKPADIPYDVDLYQQLQAANVLYAQYDGDISLYETRISRLPLIGPVWHWLRLQVHRVALFYVERAVRRQIQVNEHLVQALNRLTAVTQTQQRIIARLQAEVDGLRVERDDE